MKNNHIFLFSLLILGLAVLSFNFQGLTGEVTHSEAVMEIIPSIVKAGQFVQITINPGSGSENWVDLYTANNNLRIDENIFTVCRASKCYEQTTVNWRVPQELALKQSSDYFIQLQTKSGQKVRSYFTVVP